MSIASRHPQSLFALCVAALLLSVSYSAKWRAAPQRRTSAN
jgi:hypothetical protein